MPHATRFGSVPTASTTRSAWRAAIPITFGPVAATSTGTLGPSPIQRMELADGPCANPSFSASGAASSAMLVSSNATSSPRRYACRLTRWFSNHPRRAGARPRCASALSPRPMPSTIRPRDTSCTERADDAVTAGCRVTGFVTDVATPSFLVVVAARARKTYGSPERFCESTTSMPSQPRSSASRANSALRVGAATVLVQNSMASSPPCSVLWVRRTVTVCEETVRSGACAAGQCLRRPCSWPDSRRRRGLDAGTRPSLRPPGQGRRPALGADDPRRLALRAERDGRGCEARPRHGRGDLAVQHAGAFWQPEHPLGHQRVAAGRARPVRPLRTRSTSPRRCWTATSSSTRRPTALAAVSWRAASGPSANTPTPTTS